MKFRLRLYAFIVIVIAVSGSTVTFAAGGFNFRQVLAAPKVPRINPKTKKPTPLSKDEELANAQSKQEKTALLELSKGSTEPALRRYRALSKVLAGTKQGGAIDLRILEIHKSVYERKGSPVPFQKALIDTIERYDNDQLLGPANAAMAQKISNVATSMHRNLAKKQAALGQAKKSSSSDRSTALRVLDRYIQGKISDTEKDTINASRGEIQFLQKSHVAAASTFSALAESKKNTTKYWLLAIRSQKALANWPDNPPWDKIPPGKSQFRETLKSMYASLGQDNHWPIAAHIGLLDINLGRRDDAFNRFKELISKSSPGAHPNNASGYLAATYLQEKNWSALEETARTMQKQRLIGIRGAKTYKPRELLGTALLEGGLERHQLKEDKIAVTKLSEFVQGWREHPRHDFAYYTLAHAQYGAGSYRTSVETLIAFLKAHQKSKYRRDAMINGGAWSRALAWDDHVMFFLESHIKEFPKDEETLVSQDSLADLYMGKEHYDAASRILEMQLTDSRRSAEQKSDIARRLLDLHERNGSEQSATRVADLILKKFNSSQDIAATALSLKGRMSAKTKKTQLTVVSKQLSALDASDKTVAEAQSEIHFLIAESLAEGAFDKEIYSLTSRNPLADLNESYNKYEKVRLEYEAACGNAGASWCGPAMHRIARVSELYGKTIEPLTIPPTLGPEEVKPFETRKRAIIDALDNRILYADDRSATEAKSGATNPAWTAAILWQNSAEWYAERVTGETGNGYIQWTAVND